MTGRIQYGRLDGPLGEILIVAGPDGLVEIRLDAAGRGYAPAADWCEGGPLVDAARAQLEEYFAGRRTEFDILLSPRGTPFQQRVWRELRTIPFGETTTYAEIARRIGRPTAVRAVGAANGRNPLPIVVPCHRVVGSDGTLTGYAGGLPRKRALLELEATVTAREGTAASSPGTAAPRLPGL